MSLSVIRQTSCFDQEINMNYRALNRHRSSSGAHYGEGELLHKELGKLRP